MPLYIEPGFTEVVIHSNVVRTNSENISFNTTIVAVLSWTEGHNENKTLRRRMRYKSKQVYKAVSDMLPLALA